MWRNHGGAPVTLANAILGTLAALSMLSSAVLWSLWRRAESVVDGYRMGGADARVKRLTEEVDKARLEACAAKAGEQSARRALASMRADRDAGLVALERWGEELKTGKWHFVGDHK